MVNSVEFGFKQGSQPLGERVYASPEAAFWNDFRQKGLGDAIANGVTDQFTALKNVGNVLAGKEPDGDMTTGTALLYDWKTNGIKGAGNQFVAGAGNTLQNNLNVLTGKPLVGVPSNRSGRVIVSN